MGEPRPPWLAAAAPALALYAQLLDSGSARVAAHRLVAHLANEHGLGRASLGWRHRGRTELLATSAAPGDPGEAERRLGAMDEAMDQGLPLTWPDAAECRAEGGPLLLETALLQRPLGGAVAVLPLGRDGVALGALCLERPAGPPFDAAQLESLSHLLALAAPAIDWMRRAEAPWPRRALEQARQALAALRQPEARTRRRLLAAGGLLAALTLLLPLPYTVGGRARLEGAEQRVLAAPADGFVRQAHVRPGDRVRAGQPLLDLMEEDLKLERERWASQRAQHENAYAAAMARADRVGAATAMARVVEAQSQLALTEEALGRGRIVAPFDGLVVEGDLAQSVGAPVRQGDKLLTLATLDRHRVVVEIDETDIAAVAAGQSGHLTLSSQGWRGEALVVERMAPMARTVDGRNVFEVEARLVAAGVGLRPGLLGRADFEVGRRPPLAAWLGRATDRLRLAWWAWLG